MEFIYILNPTLEGTTFRLIVTGGRDYRDWPSFCLHMDNALKRKIAEGRTIEIVHGDCMQWDENNNPLPTADQMADRYGKEHGYIVTPVRANWRRYSKRAGPIRNAVMRDYGHAVIAFWNFKSPGTRDMVTISKKKNLPVHIVPCQY